MKCCEGNNLPDVGVTSAPRRDEVKDERRIWRRSSTTTEIKTAPVEEQFQIDEGVTLRDMAFDLGLSCGTVQHRDECFKITVRAVKNGYHLR